MDATNKLVRTEMDILDEDLNKEDVGPVAQACNETGRCTIIHDLNAGVCARVQNAT